MTEAQREARSLHWPEEQPAARTPWSRQPCPTRGGAGRATSGRALARGERIDAPGDGFAPVVTVGRGRTACAAAIGRICWPVARATPATGGPKLPPRPTVACGPVSGWA